MRTYLSIIMIILSFTWLSAQEVKEVTVPLSDATKIATLSIETKTGSVTVKGSARKDIFIKYSIVEKSKEGEADKEIEEREGLKKITNKSMDFSIEEVNNEVIISSNSWFKGVDLDIELPSNVNLNINNGMGGDVTVSNVSGDLNLSSYLGSVYANDVSGVVNANSYTGEIKVLFNTITPGKDMSFINYTGDIDLTFPSGYKASMKMKTAWGDIFSDLDLITKDSSPEVKVSENGKFKLLADSWTYASLNGGGPEISIKSHTGSIFLRKKK